MTSACSRCGAPEVASGTPRTTYACGASDYEQRPGTQTGRCARYCMHCLQVGGAGARELRPYGPGGRDVCAECTFNGPPERLAEAERQLGARLITDEPLLLDTREQIGPRRMFDHEKRALTKTANPRNKETNGG